MAFCTLEQQAAGMGKAAGGDGRANSPLQWCARHGGCDIEQQAAGVGKAASGDVLDDRPDLDHAE